MTLVDSAVWIGWLRNERSAQTARLEALLDDGAAAICPVILQELLQGTTSQVNLQTVQARFSRLPMLMPGDALRLHVEAGSLYARARWSGITARSPHDCLIAVTALLADVPLLHDDRDFERLAEVEPGLVLMRG